MLRLINNQRLMGTFVNGRVFNVVSWAIIAALIGLTGLLVLSTVAPGLMSSG
jgi:Mn2+/Fe2+ NRAMP family transporter